MEIHPDNKCPKCGGKMQRSAINKDKKYCPRCGTYK